jgi:hypothetical protein
MPTLHGEVPIDRGDEQPCIWCRVPTDVRFVPEFSPSMGPQPLHMTCAMLMIRAWQRWRKGMTLDAETSHRLLNLAS